LSSPTSVERRIMVTISGTETRRQIRMPATPLR
jgi:hypothetical protein